MGWHWPERRRRPGRDAALHAGRAGAMGRPKPSVVGPGGCACPGLGTGEPRPGWGDGAAQACRRGTVGLRMSGPRAWRAWAWLALLPMLLWPPARPGEGEWDLHALDVGQGSALLVRTARHALLFDAGARHARDADQGARTIVPALKALGVRR